MQYLQYRDEVQQAPDSTPVSFTLSQRQVTTHYDRQSILKSIRRSVGCAPERRCIHLVPKECRDSDPRFVLIGFFRFCPLLQWIQVSLLCLEGYTHDSSSVTFFSHTLFSCDVRRSLVYWTVCRVHHKIQVDGYGL